MQTRNFAVGSNVVVDRAQIPVVAWALKEKLLPLAAVFRILSVKSKRVEHRGYEKLNEYE